MSFRLVPKSVTFNGVMALILLCHRIRVDIVAKTFTFAISSHDNFLVIISSQRHEPRNFVLADNQSEQVIKVV